jgi:hypothetical protein
VHLDPDPLNRAHLGRIIMKRTQLLVLSVLALGLQGVAQASPFPSDAEASYSVGARDTYADQQARGGSWGVNERSSQSEFPSDAEASYSLPALGSYAERQPARPVSARETRSESAFPWGSHNIDG